VDHADAGSGGPVQGERHGIALSRGGDEPEHRLTSLDVGPSRDPSAGVVPLEGPHGGEGVDERRGDHRRVGVDTGQVGRPARDGPVDLGAGERPVLGPPGLVPVERQHDRERRGPGVPLQSVQRLQQGPAVAEVHAVGGHPGLRQMDVRVDEGRCDQPAVELDDPVRVVREVVGSGVVADPAHRAVLDAEGARRRLVGGVHVAAAQQNPRPRSRHRTILTGGARKGCVPRRSPAAVPPRSPRGRARIRCLRASSRRRPGPRRRARPR
jgi:hypothetical protein